MTSRSSESASGGPQETPLTLAEYLRYWGNDGNLMFEYPTMTKKMREAADVLIEVTKWARSWPRDERTGEDSNPPEYVEAQHEVFKILERAGVVQVV